MIRQTYKNQRVHLRNVLPTPQEGDKSCRVARRGRAPRVERLHKTNTRKEEANPG